MNRHYCCSDFHGMYDLWAQIRDYCDETDTIFFLGDAADRGKDGLKIINELINDKRVNYIMGNHEEFIIDWLNDRDSMPYVWIANGGYDTWTEISAMNTLAQDKLRRDLLWGRCNGSTRYRNNIMGYTNKKGQLIILNHSGWILEYYSIDPNYCLDGGGDKNTYLWDRTHFTLPWISKDEYFGTFQNTFVVHGHTPVQYLSKMLNLPDTDRVMNYCDGHKFDIDLASFASKKAVLFDLDELKVEKYFETRT